MASNTSTPAQPEQYHVKATEHCPNNVFPVLVYRDVLPSPINEESTKACLERHGWQRRGTWGAITTKHFHPNTHECYGVFQGTSTLVFGEGGADAIGTGVRVRVRTGDVVVIPAGVAHASVAAEDPESDELDGAEKEKYRYIGVYPEESPKWRNEWGKKKLDELAVDVAAEAGAVPIPPYDPVNGEDGPLVQIWKAARV